MAVAPEGPDELVGREAPLDDPLELRATKSGWIVSAPTAHYQLVAARPDEASGSTTAWASSLADAGMVAAVNANFFECDARGGRFSGRTCPNGGTYAGDFPLAHEQYPIGVQCAQGACFTNMVKTAAWMAHLLVYRPDAPVTRNGEAVRCSRTYPHRCVDLLEGKGTTEVPNLTGVELAVSGAPALVLRGKRNDTGAAGISYYPNLLSRGSIPFAGVSQDGRRLFLGMVQGGTESAVTQLLGAFPDQVYEAVAFDSGGSPTFWYQGETKVRSDRTVPAKLGLLPR